MSWPYSSRPQPGYAAHPPCASAPTFGHVFREVRFWVAPKAPGVESGVVHFDRSTPSASEYTFAVCESDLDVITTGAFAPTTTLAAHPPAR